MPVFGQLVLHLEGIINIKAPSIASDLDTWLQVVYNGDEEAGDLIVLLLRLVRQYLCFICFQMKDKCHGFPCHLAMFAVIIWIVFCLLVD